MSRDLLMLLSEATLAGTAAIVMVLLLRRPIRSWFGVSALYVAWLLVPAALVAVAVPASVVPVLAAPATGLAAAPMPAPSAAPVVSLDPGPWLIGLWALGLVAAAWRLLRQQRRFLAGLGKLRLRADGLLQSQASEGLPAVIGWRANIVLPADFEQRYRAHEQQLVLCHEQVHKRRGDLWVNAFVSLLRCVFWFNPLLHFAARRFRHDQEMACDAVVLKHFPHRRRTYGDALLKTELAEHRLPVGCHWFGTHPLKERITMLKRPLPSRSRGLTGLSLVFALTITVAWTAWAAQPARVVHPAGDGMAAESRAGEAGAENIVARGESVSIRDAALRVASQSGLRLANPEVLPGDKTMSFRFMDIPAVTALELIAEESGLTVRMDGDRVVFESLSKPRYPAGAAEAKQGGLVMLKVLVGVDGQASDVQYVAAESTVSKDSEFTRNAIEAAGQWKFRPAMKDGKPSAGWVMVPVRFEPPSDPSAGDEA